MKAPSTHGSSKCKGWEMKLLKSCLSHWHLDVMENEQGFLYYLGPIIVKKIRPKQHRNSVIIIYKNLKENVIKVKIHGNTIVVLKSTLGKRDS